MTTPDSPCSFPQFAPITAYNRGCRCARCVAGRRSVRAKYYKSAKGKALVWAATKAYRASPKGKANRAAYRQNPEGKAHRAADNAKRRALRRKQTPPLTATEQRRIVEIYAQCGQLSQSTGVLHHVDHRIPLSKGGAHHPDNLQILTASDNLKKGNRLP